MCKKVLLINNTATRPIIAELLGREGYGVDVVSSVEKGVQRLSPGAYDIIIVRENHDNHTWQLCQKIRSICTAPLIVISFNASASTCVKAINAGADYFLRKPFGPLEFMARVNSLLQRNSVRQPVVAGS